MSEYIAIGQKAPDFTLPNKDGENVNLSKFLGKKVVLYFYPKDSTPGCTTEACDFRDRIKDFSDKNVVIVGVSKDSSKSHTNFTDKYQLPFELLSDKEGQVCEAYGIWQLKKNYGREYEGVIRSTFIINPSGKIAATWYKVRVRSKRKSGEISHASIVRDKLTELQN